MKSANTFLAIAAVGIALAALWISYLGRTQATKNIESLSSQLGAQNLALLEARFQLQTLQVTLTDVNDRSEIRRSNLENNAPNETERKGQSVINDKQWQDIDYLKKQRLYHKQLIDNLHQDIISRKRKDRNVKPSGIEELKRRVDELYRLLDRGEIKAGYLNFQSR